MPNSLHLRARRPFPLRSVSLLWAASVMGVAVLLGLGGCATAPPDVSRLELGFPSPNSGPGRPDLDKGTARHIDAGWQALLRGDTAAARSSAAQTGTNPASELLRLQAAIVAGERPVRDLEAFSEKNPGYAAAWLSLSVAAEKADEEALALRAAETGAGLWSDKPWSRRPQTLRTRWIDDRIEAAQSLYDEDDPRGALTSLGPALALDPENRDGVLLKARSLIATEELDHAEAVLSGLERDRDVVLLSGSIAEKRGDTSAAIRIYSSLPDDPEAILMAAALAEEEQDWQSAMNLYATLPDNHPAKGSGLRKAKLRWRVSVMPRYVQDAVSSRELTRSDLAVVMVNLAPKLGTLPGGQVPLLSDIVDMPSQKEIITAAKLGLIDVDRLEHRFHPLRPVTADEVRSSVSNLGKLLEVPSPRFCTDDTTDTCVSYDEPITGEHVAGTVIEMVTEEAQ